MTAHKFLVICQIHLSFFFHGVINGLLLQMKEAENAQRRSRFSAAVYHHLCAAKIQRAFRAHQALKMAKKQIHSVIYIQVCTLA